MTDEEFNRHFARCWAMVDENLDFNPKPPASEITAANWHSEREAAKRRAEEATDE